MKKRKYYSEKKRNTKWTQPPKGHEIDFADKYIGDGTQSDMYDSKRPSYQASVKKKKKEKRIKQLKTVLSIVLCIAIVGVGYTAMDVYMIRHAKPLTHLGEGKNDNEIKIADMSLNINAAKVESVSLDSSVMLSSVTNELSANGFTGLVFDAKRDDGTIGYASSLASIDTFSAISNASSQPQASIKQLIDNDILPIARICCYQDNVVPLQDSTAALKPNGKLYKDENGNTYLNPNSDSAYSYIKDIIAELHGYGVDVFILYGFDLPSDVQGKYGDGFSNISKRLNEDFNSEIKLLEEIDKTIYGKDAETGKITNSQIRKELDEIEKPNNNQILNISTKVDYKRVINQLNRKNFNCYFIG